MKRKNILWIAAVLIVVAAAVLILSLSRNPYEPYYKIEDPNYTPGTVVDYRDIQHIDSYLKNHPDVAASIGEQIWFFAHASVGENILDGMRRLHDGDSGRYALPVIAAAEVPPDTLTGGIYALNRGNPGTGLKLTLMDSYLAAGWSGATVVMNKFCYIDAPVYDSKLSLEENRIAAAMLAAQYIDSVAAQREQYPGTLFVLTTMPVTEKDREANLMRQFYNNAIRRYCNDTGELLYDIADIESHGADGTYFYGALDGDPGPTYPLLNRSYTRDGGHLNKWGARSAAEGWYALAAAIALQNQY